ncbi:MAG: hypothetical protein DI533_00445 [Cereibacter sphaeroides]|uniref:Uncharacterized protein n=1 Tax=Cereibacter sphaeroides TaxID=1063 RepID=A0A2W5SEF3_CERSP|nr:MAG: hypothetical protein DI533_00445 [Cereibacter sphaeroides]
MTLANCLATKAKSGLISGIKSKDARERFRVISEGLIKQGEAPGIAYQLAADRVTDEFKFKAAAQKRRLLADISVRADLESRVAAKSGKALRKLAAKTVDDLDFDARAIRRLANSRITDFLTTHNANLLGKVKNPMQFKEFMKAVRGEATSDATAQGFAKSVNDLNEWFRQELNKYGYNIGKHENWGLPHSHNAMAIGTKGLDQWRTDIKPLLDWSRMTDETIGEPFRATPSEAFQDEFLANVYGNITYGRNSKSAEWDRSKLKGGNPLEKHRVLEFKDTDAWAAYNQKYGSASPFNTLMQHIDHMSRELAMARRFGRDHEAAVDYMGQLITRKNRETASGAVENMKAEGNVALAKNMVRVMSGGIGPKSYLGAVSAKFFSTTRKVLNSALLDRAVVISIPSDLNSARMAAQAVEMNPANFMSDYVNLMRDSLKDGGATREDFLRQGWIADSFANPGVTMSRYQDEGFAAEWADVMSNAAMQIQGLTAHTDNLKMAVQKSWAAHFASVRGLAFDQLPETLRKEMTETGGITAADWDAFRSSGGEYVAGNGATFLSPIYWQKATSLPQDQADEIYLKMQSFVEKWTERAVPSGSLVAKGYVDPKAYGLAPGSAPYELIKSAGMFKSFVGAFTMNQVRMISGTNKHWSGATGKGAKAAYIAELVASTTAVGALGIQINEMLMGRDPQPMNDDMFWWRSILRGGGLGPIGDILSTGATSWGGGLSGYLAGPIAQAGGDVLKLTIGNVAQAYSQVVNGDEIDLNLVEDTAKFISRYTPMGQSPVLAGGAAFDRLVLDQLQMALDPGAADAMVKAAKRRQNLYGNGSWWMPGSALPNRAPNLGNALGQ